MAHEKKCSMLLSVKGIIFLSMLLLWKGYILSEEIELKNNIIVKMLLINIAFRIIITLNINYY